MAVDLTGLKAQVDAQSVVIDGIGSDYVNMKAQIEALQAALDANDTAAIQAGIDEMTAIMVASNARLKGLDDSVAPVPPPGEPA